MYFQSGFWRRQGMGYRAGNRVFSACASVGFGLAVSAGLACTLSSALAATAVLHGQALYQARMLPPPNAVLIVTLEDVSRADGRPRELASVQMAVKSGPPYGWQMAYDPKAIEGGRHVLRARILVGGKLFMGTDDVYPAIGNGAEKWPQLMLRRVQAAPTDPALVMPPALSEVALQGTYWKLTELGGQAMAPQGSQAPEAHIVLHGEGRLAGSDGCNRLTGIYTQEAGQLWFERLGGTKMMCPASGGVDAIFLRALLVANAWRLTGSTLELMAGREPVARFVAVALN